MAQPTYKELLDAGVHFGHLKKKWNPKMQPYIFGYRAFFIYTRHYFLHSHCTKALKSAKDLSAKSD